ncbi:flagellar basal body rod protein FlgC [Endozoicomonadaceae bacterium StTr2]
MSLGTIFDIAGSAMSAQSLRLNTVASNLANAESTGEAEGDTYRAKKPVFAAVLEDAKKGFGNSQREGVYSVKLVDIVDSEAPLEVRNMPGHPLANDNGEVYYPNVNVVEEMADMMSASSSFQTSIEVMNGARKMQERLLALGS